MPLLKRSSYPGAPFYQRNGHWQTILPAVLRKVRNVSYERERLELADGDFLDLDWLDQGAQRLVILCHGLEGNSQRHYILGMAQAFQGEHWDVLAWNCRSCSGEMNRTLRLYSHGEIGDFTTVVEYALMRKNYREVALVGFSMGGSIIMKYLGTLGEAVPAPISKAVAFSAPCDLKASAASLELPENAFFKRRFFRSLSTKIQFKAAQFPGKIDVTKLAEVRTWRDFDEWFSAPMSGLRSADEFYAYGSSQNYIAGIRIPTLLVNAKNDPILPPACSPTGLATNHPYFYLEMPNTGGHVGFAWSGHWGRYWSEHRALEFVMEKGTN